MKKILFVLNHLQYSDGVAKALLNLVNNLDLEKYDITICSLFKYDNEFVSRFNSKIKTFSLFKGYFRGLRRILKFVPAKLLIKKIIKDNYDVVIAYQYGMPTELLSRDCVKSPKIVFMHGYDQTSQKYHEKYNKVVCVSQFASEKYKLIFSQPEKVTYCHNVIEVQEVEDKSQNGEEAGQYLNCTRPILSFVGRLSPEKGVERTLYALADLKQKNLKFTYLIVGDGSLKTSIENKINELDLCDYVKMVGFQKNPYQFMAVSDCYVCSSFSEGLSTTSIEAAILKKDIISTDVSGAREIVLDPDIGLVCENSEEALKDALENYISNLYNSDKFNSNRLKAKEKWNKQKTIERFEEIINSL